MIQELFFVFWYFLPAGVANMTPIFVAKLPILRKWSYPLDCYKTYRGKRILGDHKTVRGMISGLIAGIVIAWLQRYFYTHMPMIQTLIPRNYASIDPVILGILAGLGALTGDAIKSFFKRRRGIPSGESWFPFDQLDYVIGGTLFMALYFPLTVIAYILLYFMWFLMHPLSTWIGYELKLKKSPL